MADDFKEGVTAGVTGAGVGSATGAAIGTAAGAALGPFAPIAAPIGAAIGALVGFFIWLGQSTAAADKEAHARLIAAQKAHEASLNATALVGTTLSSAAQYAWGVLNAIAVETDPAKRLAKVENWIKTSWNADLLRRLAAQEEAYAPIVNEIFNGLRYAAKHPGESTSSLRKVVDFAKALGSLPGSLDADPFAYLRPPLSQVFGPALAAAGINISDPNTLKIMRGSYDQATFDFSQAKWAGLGLTTSMDIYGGPTEAQRQAAEKAAAIFARSGGGTQYATPIMGAAQPSGFPTWAYVLLGLGVVGGGYYLLK